MTIISSQPKAVAPGKLEQELTAIDAGVLKDIPAKTAIALDGTPLTAAQIDSKLKGYLETIQAANTAAHFGHRDHSDRSIVITSPQAGGA